MISSQALRVFNNALLDLYAPGLDLDCYGDRGFRFLARLVESELSVYGMRDMSCESPGVALQFDRMLPDAESAVLPFGLLAPKYPLFCGSPEINKGRPHYRTDFYSDRQYRSLDIHAEVFRRWNHENFMTMCITATGHKSFFFGFSRDTIDFSLKERALLELAQRHLIVARRLAVSLTAVKPWLLSPEMLSGRGFTPRECEVLYWLTEGKSNIEIATILHIGLATVKGYLTSIFNKTGTSNRLAAMLHALELAKAYRERQSFQLAGPGIHSAPFGPPPTKVG